MQDTEQKGQGCPTMSNHCVLESKQRGSTVTFITGKIQSPYAGTQGSP